MSQAARRSVSVISILLIALAGGLLMRATLAEGNDADSNPPPLTMDGDVEVLLLRMGIEPEGLAAAGISGAGLQTALAAEQDALEGALTTLASRDAAYAEAKNTVDALRRKVIRGQASPEEIQQLATARTALAAATSARDTLLDGLVADLVGNAADSVATRLQQIRANRRWRGIPAAYRVEARTERQWIEIRNALAAKRTHEEIGDGVPQEVTAFISNLDSENDVSTAKANLASNLTSVQATWDSVFGG